MRRPGTIAPCSTWTSSIPAGSGATLTSRAAPRSRPPWARCPSISRSAATPRPSAAATRGPRTGSLRSAPEIAPASRRRVSRSPRQRPPTASRGSVRCTALRTPAAATCACASRGRGSTRSGPFHGWRSESEPMSDILLLTPLPGWAIPLDEVDDEVFAGRMLGDGIAVDPTDGTLRAPCDGEVTTVPESAHAVSLRAAGGAELLLHVGIDTVALKGEGFEALVREGQRVSAGDPLLRFDLDRIARGARSLVTPVIVTEPARFRIVERRSGRLLRAGDTLMTLREIAAAAGSLAATGGAATGSLQIALPHGLHAWPAAIVAQAMRPLRAEATLSLRGRTADVRSAVSLLSLGARHGDALALRSTGVDAGLVRGALERALAQAASVTRSEE